jgi:hypothetical protein
MLKPSENKEGEQHDVWSAIMSSPFLLVEEVDELLITCPSYGLTSYEALKRLRQWYEATEQNLSSLARFVTLHTELKQESVASP